MTTPEEAEYRAQGRPPAGTEQPDDELIELVRSGRTDAFRFLVERYQHRVAQTVRAMLGNAAEAEDVGQETFIRFYNALDSFRGDASVATFLNRIAVNLSLNALKRRKRFFLRFERIDRDHAGAISLPAKEDAEAFEKRQLIEHALQQLDPDFRAVVVLRYIEGYSTKETAGMLDIPLGTVLSRLSRAQKKMRDWLLPYMNDEEQ